MENLNHEQEIKTLPGKPQNDFTIELRNPGNLLVSVKYHELEFEATLLPQETETHTILGKFVLRKTYEFMLSCHGIVEKIEWWVPSYLLFHIVKLWFWLFSLRDTTHTDRTLDAEPIYNSISRTQSLQITSSHRSHGLQFIEPLQRYIELGEDPNDPGCTELEVYIWRNVPRDRMH